MWDFPGPGLEPVSPALAGGFLTSAPPGKLYPPLEEEHSGVEKADGSGKWVHPLE